GLLGPAPAEPQPESYTIASGDTRLVIGGSDPSGVLYGCLEAIARLQSGTLLSGKKLGTLNLTQSPALKRRATVLPLLSGKTPSAANQPWLFDREWWTGYLDQLLAARFNTVCVWFEEVDAGWFEHEAELWRWVLASADERGIGLVLSAERWQ